MFFTKNRKGNTLSDSDLISGYRTTEDSAYAGELFQRHSHLVFGACMKYLKNEENSRDAVMQIFEKLLTDLKNHEIENFKGWLHTVAKNHCLMQLRTKKNFQTINEESAGEFMESGYSLHHSNEEDAELKMTNLEDCMRNLADEQKKCIEFFYLEEKCYKEIVELTKYSMNEVKSYIQNGKRNLKNCLSGK
jgi:RNA polymerase sigma factor (sigma-70 family)